MLELKRYGSRALKSFLLDTLESVAMWHFVAVGIALIVALTWHMM